jgi:hypothetical protein
MATICLAMSEILKHDVCIPQVQQFMMTFALCCMCVCVMSSIFNCILKLDHIVVASQIK